MYICILHLRGRYTKQACTKRCNVEICVNTFLPPTNEVCEGYVFTPVCQSFCSQGVFASVHAGIHTPTSGSRYPPPPGAGTPFTVHAGRYGQQAGSTYPTGMHTCAVARFNVAPEHLSSRTRFLTPPIVNSECPPP